MSKSGTQLGLVRQTLSEWFAKRHPIEVEFREETSPQQDTDARYSVAYEAIFEPDSVNRARVEIWVTTVGEVGIGVEKWNRIAQRLGVKARDDRFAAGHEPQDMSVSGLLAILNAIAGGQIAVSATVIPWWGLVSTHAVAPPDVLEALDSADYHPAKWLSVARYEESAHLRHLLQFDSW